MTGTLAAVGAGLAVIGAGLVLVELEDRYGCNCTAAGSIFEDTDCYDHFSRLIEGVACSQLLLLLSSNWNF